MQDNGQKKTVEVAAAVIFDGAKVLATRRLGGPWDGWWEFPGGKIESGENAGDAAVRELREELDVDITLKGLLSILEWDYPEFHLRMHCFESHLADPSHVMHLSSHSAARWLEAGELDTVRWLPADEQFVPSIALLQYLKQNIIPRYDHFDRGHDRNHVETVICQAMHLADFYDVDRMMLYTAAAYHDTGICEGREHHHTVSGRIIRDDVRLREYFSPEQIETIARAAEDHRASAKTAPRSIYGRLLAEADRVIEPMTIIRRTIQYGLGHEPHLDREGQWERTRQHLVEKYGEGGYLKLWIPESDNAERLAALRRIIADTARLRTIFDQIFAEETL